TQPHADAQDARSEHVGRTSKRAGAGRTVAAEDGSGVERIEQVGRDLHRGVSAQLQVLGQAEIDVPEALVPLAVEGRHGQRAERAVASGVQAEDDGVDIALATEDAGADLEVGGELVERIEHELPAGVVEDVTLPGPARTWRDLSAVDLRA